MLNISEICFLINATFVVWHIEIWKCGHPVTFYCKEREREREWTLWLFSVSSLSHSLDYRVSGKKRKKQTKQYL